MSESPESMKTAIERLLNITLLPEECPAPKLAQMLELAKQPPAPIACPLQVPIISDHGFRSIDRIDPRLRLRPYLRMCYHDAKRDVISQCGLKLNKLDIVLDLDYTLIECIMPMNTDSPYAVQQFQERLKRETKRDVKELVVPSEQRKLTLLYTIRPGAETFLKRLAAIANLYVYSQGKCDYVYAILGSLRWREFFRSIVICPQERQKSLRERIGELAEQRNSVLILDDQRLVCLLQFSFDRSLPLYRESNDQTAKFSFLERMIRKIHENMFIDQYTRPAISYFYDLQARKLRGKSFKLSLSANGPEEREVNIRFLIEKMGGSITNEMATGVLEITDREGATMTEGDSRSLNYVIASFFKEVPRREL